MNAQKKENVRTQKTCALIRKTFREMLIEMDYNQISIKKLTERADINRRTFYLHYGSIDELLNELIDEIADGYFKMTNSLNGYYDQREIARAFLLYFAQQDELHEKIICNSNFKYISDRINRRISDINQGHIDDLGKVSPYLKNIIIAYLNMSCLGMYRRWVRKDIIISGNVQVPFFALHPVKDLIFCILSSRHDQWISFYVIYGYRFFICKLMILPDKNPPGFLLGKPDIL